MSEQRLNCWEHMRCGREPGGVHVDTLGVCPAAQSQEHDGINNGTRGGRYCWAIAGTLCNGEAQGHFAQKFRDCIQCPFYLEVERQEDRFFVVLATLQA